MRVFAATFLLAITSAFFVALPAHAALPPGVTQGATVEGITEYRLANGLRVLLFPDAAQAQDHRQRHLSASARAHENYGETGMAHLLEHLVFKGTPSRGNIMQELGRRGMSFNGSDVLRPHQLLRVVHRLATTNLEWALAMEADRMVNSFVRKQRPRHRDDGGAQRVRERREQPAARAVRADARVGVPVAQLRQARRSARAPTSRTSTSAACRRSTSRTTSRTTRCWSSPASSTPTQTLALVAKYFGPIPKPARTLPRHLHAGAGAGRRALGHAAPRRQLASSSA